MKDSSDQLTVTKALKNDSSSAAIRLHIQEVV
jgi:hypothetical protein